MDSVEVLDPINEDLKVEIINEEKLAEPIEAEPVSCINELGLPNLNKTFFIDGIEYRVSHINDKEKRFSADPHTEKGKNTPQVNDKFMIERNSFIITYVHSTKKRITAKPMSIGY